MTRLAGKSALVTGAGSGFGEAIAHRFAAEGARVAVNDLDAAKAARVAEAIKVAGGDAVAAPGDAAASDSVAKMMAACVAAFGRMDILMLNAGVAQRPTPIEQVEDRDFERIFSANVRSVYLGAKHAQPQFKAQGGGVIVVTASTIATRPRPGLGVYAASKGAAISLTKALAVELAPIKVRVNAVCPSAGETPMLKEFMGGEVTPEAHKLFASRVPLGRLCEPADVADAALFLASDEARFLTGITVDVDGGRSV
ncbi:MAG: glucose 1-dehydrogenase [Alphaproteobacteria bacterium]